jgi:hypothetical protein
MKSFGLSGKVPGLGFFGGTQERIKCLAVSGEPGRTRTCNPLLNPEMLCSWFFKHFLASYMTVLHGVRHGSVPKLVPRFSKMQRANASSGRCHRRGVIPCGV